MPKKESKYKDKKTACIYLEETEYAELKEQADKKRMSFSAYLVLSAIEKMEREKKEVL